MPKFAMVMVDDEDDNDNDNEEKEKDKEGGKEDRLADDIGTCLWYAVHENL